MSEHAAQLPCPLSPPPQVLDAPPCIFGPGGPLLPTGPIVGSIVEVPQYSQKDMDAAVRTRRGAAGSPRAAAGRVVGVGLLGLPCSHPASHRAPVCTRRVSGVLRGHCFEPPQGS